MNRIFLFDVNNFDYIAIKCGYTERLIEKKFDFTKFSKDYGFENIEFIGNINYKKIYPEENINILKYFCAGTLIFKKKDGENLDVGTILRLIHDIDDKYDFCSCMNCYNIYDVSGYTINLNDKSDNKSDNKTDNNSDIDDNKVENSEDNIIKVLHISIDTESG